jgi:hypothetical protein
MRAGAVLVVLALACPACGGGPPTAADVAGVYHADLPPRGTPGRIVTLELGAGNTAEMAIDYRNGQAFAETGTWSLSPRGEIRVVLARDGFGPVTTDVTFRWAGGTLTAIAFDTLRWGGAGFALTRE